MKNELKLNNKGFSLVELIVVIAIMAILVGVLAPSVLGQLDKAKISKDKQTIETVVTAVATAYADQMVTSGKPTGSGAQSITAVTFGSTAVSYAGSGNESNFNGAIQEIVGYTTVVLESNEYSGKIPTIEINLTTGKVTGKVTGNSGVEFAVTR